MDPWEFRREISVIPLPQWGKICWNVRTKHNLIRAQQMIKALTLLETFLPTRSKNVASVKGWRETICNGKVPRIYGHNLKSSGRWDISAWATVTVLAAIAIKLLNRHRWQIITLNPDSRGENRSGGVTSTANRHLSSLSAENQHAEPIC